MQSFSSSAKAEICRVFPQEHCCAVAELFGIFLFCGSFTPSGIRIVTESAEFASILPKLLHKAFSLSFDERTGDGMNQKFVFQICSRGALEKIMEAYGFGLYETVALQINFPVVEKDCCKAAFLRGAFLSGGSATDPEKGYHAELSTTHGSVARQCCSLIQEVLGFLPLLSERGGSHIIYLKKCERIADFFAYLGAGVASMTMTETRLEKDLKNRVNRRCNCDDANITKVIDASSAQMDAIRALRSAGLLETLSPKLRQAASAREENPEASIAELADLMTPPISKPAMAHRLKQLVELAKGGK